MEGKPLTELQKKLFDRMLSHALVELRYLCWGGEALQAADLADAFHNLPSEKHAALFAFPVFRHDVETYHNKYYVEGQSSRNYLEMLDKVEREEQFA